MLRIGALIVRIEVIIILLKDIVSIGAIVILSLIFLGIIYVIFYQKEVNEINGRFILKYSLGAKIIIFFVHIIPIGGIVAGLYINAFKEGKDTLIAYIILVISICSLLIVYFNFFYLRFILTPNGLIKKNIFRKDIKIQYDEIKTFLLSNYNTDYCIIKKDGSELKISDYIDGRNNIFKELEKRISLENFEIISKHKASNYYIIDKILSDIVQDYADNAIIYAKERGIILDFSQESINKLEDILQKDKNKFFRKEEINIQTRMFGAFLGEVIRKNIGGTWMFSKNLFILKFDEFELFPFNRVYKRITEGEEFNIYHYYKVIEND